MMLSFSKWSIAISSIFLRIKKKTRRQKFITDTFCDFCKMRIKESFDWHLWGTDSNRFTSLVLECKRCFLNLVSLKVWPLKIISKYIKSLQLIDFLKRGMRDWCSSHGFSNTLWLISIGIEWLSSHSLISKYIKSLELIDFLKGGVRDWCSSHVFWLISIGSDWPSSLTFSLQKIGRPKHKIINSKSDFQRF